MQKIDLPAGWVQTTVGHVLRVRNGYAFSSKDYRAEGIPLIRQSELSNSIAKVADAKRLPITYLNKYSEYIVRKGDLLLGMSGAIGNISRYMDSAPALQNQRTGLLLLTQELDALFAAYVLEYVRPQLITKGKGIGVQNISVGDIEGAAFPLPPIAEQRRLAAKLDELFSGIDTSVVALKRARANLRRYQAAVLKAAVEGKLTAEWRKSNPPSEPADKLLERILVERRKKWEEAQLARFAAQGKQPPKGWQDKYRHATPLDEPSLPSLPEGWRWVTLDTISEIAGGLTKGQTRRADERTRDVPYLRVANVQRGYLDLSEMKSIAATEAEIAELSLQPGDILFNEGGDRDKLGRGWVWEGQIAECVHQNHVFRARLKTKGLQPKFVSIHGNAFGRNWFLKRGKQSVNLASINMNVLRRFPVPLPPINEQTEIVREVEDSLSMMEKAEAEMQSGLRRATRLRQAILKRAFEGKLVPQDPNDEPASVLLERIRARRTVDATAGSRAAAQKRGREIASKGGPRMLTKAERDFLRRDKAESLRILRALRKAT